MEPGPLTSPTLATDAIQVAHSAGTNAEKPRVSSSEYCSPTLKPTATLVTTCYMRPRCCETSHFQMVAPH
eukprot:1251744-Amphidinium_carterae.2